MTRTEREQIVDEIICKYFGKTWCKKTTAGGRTVDFASKTEQGNKVIFVAATDGGKLLQAICVRIGNKTIYNSTKELFAAADKSAFGRARS